MYYSLIYYGHGKHIFFLLPKQVLYCPTNQQLFNKYTVQARYKVHCPKHTYKNIRHSPCRFEAHSLNISQDLLHG